jgi:hypothetical protein
VNKIQTRIKTPFGEVVIEGETPQQILSILKNMPENFVESVSEFVSNKMTPSGAQLKGIVEITNKASRI